MADKPDWFKMDPAKFLQDGLVEAMSTLELGAAFRLLCRQWIDGWIPDDQALLGRLCRLDRSSMAEAWPILSQFFPVIEEGKRANRFMWIERDAVMAAMKVKQDEGRAAAERRWAKTREVKPWVTNGSPMPDPMQEENRIEKKREEKKTASAPRKRAAKPKDESTLEEILGGGKGTPTWEGYWALVTIFGGQPKNPAPKTTARLYAEATGRQGLSHEHMHSKAAMLASGVSEPKYMPQLKTWLEGQGFMNPDTPQGAPHAANHPPKHARSAVDAAGLRDLAARDERRKAEGYSHDNGLSDEELRAVLESPQPAR